MERARKMLGIMVELSINMCMEHHFYIYEGKVKMQGEGGGIGFRLSEAFGGWKTVGKAGKTRC